MIIAIFHLILDLRMKLQVSGSSANDFIICSRSKIHLDTIRLLVNSNFPLKINQKYYRRMILRNTPDHFDKIYRSKLIIADLFDL
jgi:hypothetical protein